MDLSPDPLPSLEDARLLKLWKRGVCARVGRGICIDCEDKMSK